MASKTTEDTPVASMITSGCAVRVAEPPALAGVSVEFLDAPFGVAAVAAHVELAVCARATWHRVRPAHHAGHQVSGGESRAGGCRADTTQRLVTQDQSIMTRRRPAVL